MLLLVVASRRELSKTLGIYYILSHMKVPSETAEARERRGRPTYKTVTLRSGANLSNIVHKLAHEIGNPLTSIISFGTVLQRFTTDIAGEQSKSNKLTSYSQSIIDEAWRIAAVNERTVALLSERTPSPSANDLHNVLVQALRKVKARFRGVQATIQVEPSLPSINFEESQLRLLLTEVLANACEAVLRELESVQLQPILVQARTVNRALELSITNSVSKPCALELNQLFDPFVTTYSDNRHLGLGLTVAWAIVERFHGTMELTETKHGEGYIFSTIVRLPLSMSTSLSPEGETDAMNARAQPSALVDELRGLIGTHFSVLVIEDEPTVASAIQKLLELLLGKWTELHCTFAHDREALRLMDDGEKIDIILCDINLRETSGQYLYEIVRSRWPQYQTKFAFLTADQKGEQVQSFLEGSGRPYLMKPFETEQLLTLILRVLQGSTGAVR